MPSLWFSPVPTATHPGTQIWLKTQPGNGSSESSWCVDQLGAACIAAGNGKKIQSRGCSSIAAHRRTVSWDRPVWETSSAGGAVGVGACATMNSCTVPGLSGSRDGHCMGGSTSRQSGPTQSSLCPVGMVRLRELKASPLVTNSCRRTNKEPRVSVGAPCTFFEHWQNKPPQPSKHSNKKHWVKCNTTG
jgi:hypothetical protein